MFVFIKNASIDSVKNDSMTNVVIKNIVMDARFYEDSDSLDKEENRKIKSLLLNVIKSQHSIFFSVGAGKLYAEECHREEHPLNTIGVAKGLFIVINYDFMDSVRKIAPNEYKAIIQMETPDDWCYYFTIKVIDGKYVVSYYEIDP